jgi:hypothetical protein
VAQPKTNEAAAFVIDAKMAKALADRWRSRILMELSVKPLSPSMFVEEVGGELRRIARCFRQLAEWGYIELAETEEGGRRRGGVEHVYRTIHRAHFDTAVWAGMPRVYRDAFSDSILESYLARISEATKARTFDAELDRHFSWDEILLDRVAWVRLVDRLDEILHWLPGLAIEAAERMAETGEEPIPTTVGLAAFRAAAEARAHLAPQQSGELVRPPDATPFVISAKTAKAVANKWRSRILMELRVRQLSRTQFAKEIGGNIRTISRCFGQLEEWQYIEVIETLSGGQRRGGTEKIYRLKQRAHFDTKTWEDLPRFLRDEFSVAILDSYFARVTEAIEADTFDADVDRHLSWDGLALDRIAWAELIARLDETLSWIPTLGEEAAERMVKTNEEPIPTVFSLAAFRSPRTSEITSQTGRQDRKQG